MLCRMLADKLRRSACFIFILLLHAVTLFSRECCEREQEVYAGWPNCSAELLNTGWRVLAAKQTDKSTKRANQYLSVSSKEICDLGKLATRTDICDTSRTNKVKIWYDLNHKVGEKGWEGGKGITTFLSNLKNHIQFYWVSKSLKSSFN